MEEKVGQLAYPYWDEVKIEYLFELISKYLLSKLINPGIHLHLAFFYFPANFLLS